MALASRNPPAAPAFDPVAYVRQKAPGLRLDPHAVLAVAHAESGLDPFAVGDNGSSYGLWQLHRGGALPGGVANPGQWAASQAGVDYALNQIAQVAAGLRGREAIANIVRRFERPANPDGEIQRAVGAYGSVGGGTVGSQQQAATPLAEPSQQQEQVQVPFAADLFAQNQRTLGQTGATAEMYQQMFSRPAALPKQPKVVDTPQGQVRLRGVVRGSSEFTQVDAEGAPDANGVRRHAARDWFLGPGAAVPSLGAGVVVEVKPSRGSSGQVYGGTVKVQLANGQVVVFRHVAPTVRVGQRVGANQQVATVVRWGDNPSSSHAHVEWWKSLSGGYRFENMLDPTPHIPALRSR